MRVADDTLTGPVVAPLGTVTVADKSFVGAMKGDTAAVLNLKPVASSRLVPVILTLEPTEPVAGVRPVMVGKLRTQLLVVPVRAKLLSVPVLLLPLWSVRLVAPALLPPATPWSKLA